MGKKNNRNYFTKETDVAIEAYNSSNDPVERDRIFRDSLHYPFYKLAENIINTYNFYNTGSDSIENLKHEIVSTIVLDKIHLFNPKSGYKAYSYFGTIILRMLLNKSKKRYMSEISKTDDIPEDVDNSDDDDDEVDIKDMFLSDLIDTFADYCKDNIDYLFKSESNKNIAECVISLFEKRYNIDIYKKKALYVYLKEMTGEPTQKITNVIKVLKKEFYSMLDIQNYKGDVLLKEDFEK